MSMSDRQNVSPSANLRNKMGISFPVNKTLWKNGKGFPLSLVKYSFCILMRTLKKKPGVEVHKELFVSLH